MKKSEMLKVITNRLTKTFGKNTQNIKLAELILEEIEEAGMAPPLVKLETTDIYGKPFYNFKNIWEEE